MTFPIIDEKKRNLKLFNAPQKRVAKTNWAVPVLWFKMCLGKPRENTARTVSSGGKILLKIHFEKSLVMTPRQMKRAI